MQLAAVDFHQAVIPSNGDPKFKSPSDAFAEGCREIVGFGKLLPFAVGVHRPCGAGLGAARTTG
jgi:hypothetical protein